MMTSRDGHGASYFDCTCTIAFADTVVIDHNLRGGGEEGGGGVSYSYRFATLKC